MKFLFSAPAIKINRAKRHLVELETETAAFIASIGTLFTAEIQEGIGVKFTFNLEGSPEYLGGIVGDIVHNLRAALDLTACEMVRAAGNSDEGVYFPFSKSAAELDGMIRRRNFDRAGAEAVALLVRMKPCHNGNAALRLIHDLDVHDKHRALIPHAVATASPVIRMWDDDGTINPTIVGDPKLPSEIKLVFPSEVGPPRTEIIPTLHNLVQLVESVIEAFRALANREAPTSDAP